MSGSLTVLNVATGDIHLKFDHCDNPDEIERATQIIKDMKKRGYAILAREPGHDDWHVVQHFDPATLEYLVRDDGGTKEEPPKKKRGRPKGSSRRLPMKKTEAVGIARSAGG